MDKEDKFFIVSDDIRHGTLESFDNYADAHKYAFDYSQNAVGCDFSVYRLMSTFTSTATVEVKNY